MRARSNKRARQMRRYVPMMLAFLEANPQCERCGVRATVLHHRRGRQGDMLLDTRWWAASCDPCNTFAETHTGEARAEGWLLPMFSQIGGAA